MNAAICLWICASAWLNLAGWSLSALHQLNPAGYLTAILLGFAIAWFWRREIFANVRTTGHWPPWRRLRRPFPAIFLLVAALVFIGGAIYPPTNYDALTYRLPRILHWLATGGWSWIATPNARINFSGPAWEWVAAPQLALLRSDRGLFLIDFSGFLLLPGLLFSVFTKVGVAKRVAYAWMWILPLAFGYTMQAGSVGNDLTGAVFCLAAVHYGLRARRSGVVSDIWLCGLATALLTATKLSNLPLLLPCLIAVGPALPKLRKHLPATVGVVVVGLTISAAPIMLLNQIHAAHWSGDPTNRAKVQVKDPVAGVIGNSFLLVQGTFMPPLLPKPHQVNSWMLKMLPGSTHRMLDDKFPRLALNQVNEIPSEETASIGLGISLPLCLALMAAVFSMQKGLLRLDRHLFFSVGLAAWVAFLACIAKMGSEAGPRLMLPYYPLMICPLLAHPIHRNLMFSRVWRWFLALSGSTVLLPLVLSANRPLWPASRISEELARRHPGNAILQRMDAVYSAYADRNDVLAPLRAHLPAEARDIGFLADSNDTEYSLWRPFGERRVFWLNDGVHPHLQIPPGVCWLVIKVAVWPEVSDQSLADWAAEHQARVFFSTSIITLVSRGPETWQILELKSEADKIDQPRITPP